MKADEAKMEAVLEAKGFVRQGRTYKLVGACVANGWVTVSGVCRVGEIGLRWSGSIREVEMVNAKEAV